MSDEKRTKRLIGLRVIAFLLIFTVLFFNVSLLLRPVDNERIAFSALYSEKKESLDLVYIGGSVSIVCWAPYTAWESAGIASCTYGCSSIKAHIVLPLVREVLSRQSPDLLVLDLRPFQYTHSAFKEKTIRKPADYLPYFSMNRVRLLQECIPHLDPPANMDDKLAYYFDIIKYHGRWKQLREKSVLYMHPELTPSKTKGFMFVNKHEAITQTDWTAVKEKAEVSLASENYLIELLDFLTANKQEAVFVVTTYSESEAERKQYNYLADIIQSYGFEYWNANDYNAQIGIEPSKDFYNANHTNIFGAEKYTTYLAQYLSEEYALPDRRNDPNYADWHVGYPVWEELADATKMAIEEIIASEQ